MRKDQPTPNLWCPYCHQFTVLWTPGEPMGGTCINEECKQTVTIDDYDDE